MRKTISFGRLTTSLHRPAAALAAALLLAPGCGSDAGGPAVARADAAPPAPTTPACAPARVYCDATPPTCPEGEVAEAQPCPLGHCPGRCWTGRCVPCGGECRDDGECELVGRHGCCGDAGDCADGCFWAEPLATRKGDPCTFAAVCPIPEQAPPGCPTQCSDDPRCRACPHCGPHAARCEAGRCVSAWSRCEPDCSCD